MMTSTPVSPATADSSSSAEVQRPLSVMDLFRIGIGPSSSHTVGPMRAGAAFAAELSDMLPSMISEVTAQVPSRITVDLYGSLGATGRGHNTDRAVLLGLAGFAPETVNIEEVEALLPMIDSTGTLPLAGGFDVPFNIARDLRFLPGIQLPYHVNALRITAGNAAGEVLLERVYYSVGGGFVMKDVSSSPGDPAGIPTVEPLHADVAPRSQRHHSSTEGSSEASSVSSISNSPVSDPTSTDLTSTPTPADNETVAQTSATVSQTAPFPFTTGRALLDACQQSGQSIAGVVRANEETHISAEELDAHLDLVANTMFDCINAGLTAQGLLPGGLDVPRRARALADKLMQRVDTSHSDVAGDSNNWASTISDPLRAMDWVNLYALAVNEENAAGHRVVTAPTNGAAGVIPAVLGYLISYCPEAGASLNPTDSRRTSALIPWQICADDTDTTCLRRRHAVHEFLLGATAIGALIKMNASIAGAEVGCQGEVGSASAMAAAGLAQALGGTPQQVENAAEIAMEHSLGLTCDPVAGLVQIPCIERNAIAAVKAINAARMALWGDGRHTVSLDAVIETMRQTGVDMLSKYKETSAGGLAVNVVEC